MQQFRNRRIEAIQWTGENPDEISAAMLKCGWNPELFRFDDGKLQLGQRVMGNDTGNIYWSSEGTPAGCWLVCKSGSCYFLPNDLFCFEYEPVGST